MPCSLSQSEIEYEEREASFTKYGVRELPGRVAVSVACELSAIIEKHGLQSECSKLARRWMKEHKKADLKAAKKPKVTPRKSGD